MVCVWPRCEQWRAQAGVKALRAVEGSGRIEGVWRGQPAAQAGGAVGGGGDGAPGSQGALLRPSSASCSALGTLRGHRAAGQGPVSVKREGLGLAGSHLQNACAVAPLCAQQASGVEPIGN